MTNQKKLLFIFFCLFWYLNFYSISFGKDQDKLIFAVEIIRHADRTPIRDLPKVKAKYPNVENGCLTPKGLNDSFKLGQKARKFYVARTQLLPKILNNKTLYVRSTDFERTLMTAQAYLLGLYPPGTGPKHLNGKEALPFAIQPIPVHTVSREEERLLSNGSKEQQLNWNILIEKYIYPDPIWKNKELELQPNFKKWSELSGTRIENLTQFVALGDIINIRKSWGMPLLKGFSYQDEIEIIDLFKWYFVNKYKKPEIGKFIAKPILAKIIADMKNDHKYHDSLKYVLYVGHEHTILGIMSGLGLSLKEIPPFLASIRFLLYEDDGKHNYVKIQYNGKEVIIPDCGIKCSFKEFERLYLKQQVI